MMLAAMVAFRPEWRGTRPAAPARTSTETRFAIGLLPILASAAVAASAYGAAGLLPRALAIATISCVLLLLVRRPDRTGATGPESARPADTVPAGPDGVGPWRPILRWLLAFTVSAWALGFTVGTPLTMFAYFVNARERWPVAVAASIGVYAVLAGLLAQALAVPFPPGALVATLRGLAR
jgi:hypothetical protein